jgi:chromatin assembly factor 1 subunit A
LLCFSAVLSFFSATGRNENSRKRKLSSSDEGSKVLKVRCSNDNVEVISIDDSPTKKDKVVDVDENAAVKVNIDQNAEVQTKEEHKQLDIKANSCDEEMQSDNLEAEEDASKDDGSSLKAESDEEEEKDDDDDDDVSSTKSVCDPDESTSTAGLRRCLKNSTLNGSLLLDMDDKDSITSISDIPITPMKDSPKARKLTPRQLKKQEESQQRREAKEQEKRDRELQRQQEKDDRLKQKEEKEKQRILEKQERQKKRQAEIE